MARRELFLVAGAPEQPSRERETLQACQGRGKVVWNVQERIMSSPIQDTAHLTVPMPLVQALVQNNRHPQFHHEITLPPLLPFIPLSNSRIPADMNFLHCAFPFPVRFQHKALLIRQM